MSSLFQCHLETMMTTFFRVWERRARHAMGVLAVLLGAVALLFKVGWVSTTPSYQDAAWYSVSEHAGFLVTTRHANESACKLAAQQPAVVCRSGRAIAAEQGKAVSG
jgi:hypothetical protein